MTRTICFSKPNPQIKDIFTKVLKGHIAVVNTNLKKIIVEKKLILEQENFLKKVI